MAESVYIHIPFCQHICPYCDFNKYLLRSQPVTEYLDALGQEMAVAFQQKPKESIETIFVGGGTPTVLDTAQMRYLLEQMDRHVHPRSATVEWSMEANPGTVSSELLSVMKEGGVNRLSFGVQTFHASLLKTLGRIHTADDILHSVQAARSAGFENISADLMFGLPGQDLAMFKADVEQLLTLELPHISAYSLKIEPGTPFYRWHQEGKLSLPGEDEEAAMYEWLLERLTQAGYHHYEISNFAYPGYESRHNLTYWRNEEYFGFGAGAHGYLNGVRYANVSSVEQYIQLVWEVGQPRAEAHPVSREEAMEEMMFLGLRTAAGVSRKEFRRRYGIEVEERYQHELDQLKTKGLITLSDDHYRLTRKGLFLGNEVFAAFIHVD